MTNDCKAEFQKDASHGAARDANQLALNRSLYDECYKPANQALRIPTLISGQSGYRHIELPAQDWQAKAFMETHPAIGMIFNSNSENVKRGSGIFLSSTGYFGTVDHIVNPHRENLIVQTADGVEHSARIVAEDPKNDVALLKVEPTAGQKFAVAKIGSSSSLKEGDDILAAGVILTYHHWIAQVGMAPGKYTGFLKDKDAPVEHLDYVDPNRDLMRLTSTTRDGYSGGPVFNTVGEVFALNDYGEMSAETDAVPIEHVMDLAKKNGV